MECADEDNLVAILQNIVAFAFELPVTVVDQNEDPRATVAPERDNDTRDWSASDGRTEVYLRRWYSHRVSVDKQLFSLCDEVLADVFNQGCHIGEVAGCIAAW